MLLDASLSRSEEQSRRMRDRLDALEGESVTVGSIEDIECDFLVIINDRDMWAALNAVPP